MREVTTRKTSRSADANIATSAPRMQDLSARELPMNSMITWEKALLLSRCLWMISASAAPKPKMAPAGSQEEACSRLDGTLFCHSLPQGCPGWLHKQGSAQVHA